MQTATAEGAMRQRDQLLAACKWLLCQYMSYADQRYLTPQEIEQRDAALAAIRAAEGEASEQPTA